MRKGSRMDYVHNEGRHTMKKTVIAGALFFTIMVIVSGCNSTIDCEPIVILTNTDYTYDPESVPFSAIHEIFAESYAGADLSTELRATIIERMWQKAEDIGEDPQILYLCIVSTYPDWNVRPNRIPCYAERCRYQGQTIWAIAFNRANSFDEPSLSHFDLYFVSYATYDTLYHAGCFGTD
jgi:hypothetical protein